ncbi:acyltransferase family protein [Lysobacter sp. 1R34A]|uniref:acyltransferase family protein n=1 Tax=Lysobacter sp. 1R34A TaxID=3445786 RepID=UPI003EEE00E5
MCGATRCPVAYGESGQPFWLYGRREQNALTAVWGGVGRGNFDQRKGMRPEHRSVTGSLAYRPEIDGLRAIAVIGVVLYHAGLPMLDNGFVGVDIFFVISGYLITCLLLREWSERNRLNFLEFYARRVRRLLPALIVVCVAAVVAAVLYVASPDDQRAMAQSAAASLLFVGNVFFQSRTGDYFDADSATMPLLHLWSLGVEEQFYLLWPLLLLGLLRLPRPWMVGATLCLAAASLAAAERLIGADNDAAFYQMPTRFWELTTGGLIAMSSARMRGAALIACYAGVFLAVISLFVPFLPGHFPGVGALPAVAGAALILWSVHVRGHLGGAGALLRARPMVFVGLISYSLYLWHWPLLAIARAGSLVTLSPELRAGLVFAAIVLAWLSYRWIERPFRGMARARSARTVWLGSAVSAALALCLLGLASYIDNGKGAGARASRDRPENMAACHASSLSPVPAAPNPACASAAEIVDTVIWGDSHALAWQPFAWEIADRAAINITRDSCGPALGFAGVKGYESKAPACEASNRMALAYFAHLKPRTLIVAARWSSFLGDARAAEFEDAFIETMAVVSGLAERVLIMGPTPELAARAQQCIDLDKLQSCAESRTAYRIRTERARRLLNAVAARYPNVQVVDPEAYFCKEDSCGVLRDGFSLYWDDDHVSSTAARGFAEQWERSPH